ncbi:WD40 repeat-like protein [Athelia psychrophila]|uniref:WD40 repeat-like protein n=1 Tax=Athelia psychrophila TaxID=1759441 RepID=A0A166V8B3_9AGAM|nr:WD40 repeat-like protein [Fibularhizoctonia sp. CBS 109695]
MPSHESKRQNARAALDPLVTESPLAPGTAGMSRMELVSKALLAPFNHRKSDSAKLLAELAPVIMTPRNIGHTATVSSRPRHAVPDSPRHMGFATLGRAPLRMSLGTRRITSTDLQIIEATDELLELELESPGAGEFGKEEAGVSLLKGFNATIPSADKGRTRRRMMRNVDAPRIGLKKLGMHARGLLVDELDGDEEHEGQSVASEEDVVVVGRTDERGRKAKGKRRGRESLSTAKTLGKDELKRQTKEIRRDKENIHVRRSLIHSEITEITNKIEALDDIRVKLEQDLLKLQEDDLELDDELEGVKERLEFEESSSRPPKAKAAAQPNHIHQSSRRRKGPAFLPSEHNELPPGVAFMSLESHTTPITALDFSEPYGTLVSASQEDAQPRVWDLFSGTEIGRLRGHRGTVKCVQVEDQVCLTGGEDGNVRLWDLRRVEDDEWGRDGEGEMVSLSDVAEEDEGRPSDSEASDRPNGIRSGDSEATSSESTSPCVRLLEGHSKAVTALYFEDDCLVTGASDKTLRQWDLTTGQCVMTMDILWAISQQAAAPAGGPLPHNMFAGAAAAAGTFAVPTPPYSDGSWDMYQDFVGGVQFWGYGLVSGSGDGAVRMWDMRTGQAHRTLTGHTAPVTCLQFDEMHIVSGSLDKTVRIWDLRAGGAYETLQYDHPVTALQFDTRKIVAATGENGVKVYNRTSMQHSTLSINGHTKPAERLRYMDRYLVSGGRDSVVKVWSL